MPLAGGEAGPQDDAAAAHAGANRVCAREAANRLRNGASPRFQRDRDTCALCTCAEQSAHEAAAARGAIVYAARGAAGFGGDHRQNRRRSLGIPRLLRPEVEETTAHACATSIHGRSDIAHATPSRCSSTTRAAVAPGRVCKGPTGFPEPDQDVATLKGTRYREERRMKVRTPDAAAACRPEAAALTSTERPERHRRRAEPRRVSRFLNGRREAARYQPHFAHHRRRTWQRQQ